MIKLKKKSISIKAGNVNLRLSYRITSVSTQKIKTRVSTYILVITPFVLPTNVHVNSISIHSVEGGDFWLAT